MTDLADSYIERLIGREGRYSNHPADRGGETMWGITAAVARRCGYNGPMSAMPRATAHAIYRRRYWQEPGFDRVAQISPRIAEELLDTGVNMGVDARLPQRWLQQSLNLCNRRGRDYRDVGTDGVIGPATLGALQALIQRRGVADAETLMLRCLNGYQWSRYVQITEAGGPNGSQEEFFVGWILNRVGAL